MTEWAKSTDPVSKEPGALRPRADLLTIAGWGILLMPLLTMWHEIGGHAFLCAVQGGHVATIGAFYVECDRLATIGNIVVACAGVFMNILLSITGFLLWSRVRRTEARIILWIIWVSEAFVASGYFLFSGLSGYGDLGIASDGALAGLGLSWPFQIGEIIIGVASYIWLVRAAIRALNTMIGEGPATRLARRTIAHGYYASAGVGALLVGLLNPVGITITIMSAMASSFGGLAGFISVGYAMGRGDFVKPLTIKRNYAIFIAGVLTLTAFALILGPSVHFPSRR